MSTNPYDSQEYIDYVRENINPAYKLSKKEALKYAASMGTSDTLRGVGQILGESFGIDALNEYLKEKEGIEIDKANITRNMEQKQLQLF